MSKYNGFSNNELEIIFSALDSSPFISIAYRNLKKEIRIELQERKTNVTDGISKENKD